MKNKILLSLLTSTMISSAGVQNKIVHGIILTFLFSVFFVGCAAQPQFTYQKYDVNKNENNGLMIQKSKCLVETNKAIQAPIQMPCFGKGLSKGFCEGQKAEEFKEYKRLKEEIFDGCMAELGYKKVLAE